MVSEPGGTQSLRKVVASRLKAAPTETFESKQARRQSAKDAGRLTDAEREELRYLWRGYSADAPSCQGAIERKLLRQPPRDAVRRGVLEELNRHGGRCAEGDVIAVAKAEGWATRYEVQLAVGHLVASRKLERVPVDRPEKTTTCQVLETGRECSHPCRSCRWTGFELRLVDEGERGEVEMRTALRSTGEGDGGKRRRWRAQDEALEREWRQIECHESQTWGGDFLAGVGGGYAYGAARVLAILDRVPAESSVVLRAVYGGEGHGPHVDQFGPEVGPVAEMTPAVQTVRVRRATELAKSRQSATRTAAELLAAALREVTAGSVLRSKAGDKAFADAVRKQADAMLRRACTEYRKARAKEIGGAA